MGKCNALVIVSVFIYHLRCSHTFKYWHTHLLNLCLYFSYYFICYETYFKYAAKILKLIHVTYK